MALKREKPFARVRERRGLSLAQAAGRMRVSPTYLRALELGRSPLCYMLALKMAKVYDCSLPDLRMRSD